VFGVLLTVIGAIGGQIAAADLHTFARVKQMTKGREEAASIARAVAAVGHEQGAMDFYRLRQKATALRTVVRERMAERPFVEFVEVRDRFGGRILRENRPSASMVPSIATGDPEVVKVALTRGARPQGEVHVGISRDSIQREMKALTRTLQIKVGIAIAIVVAVLVAGFFYVLHLIRKNKQLEVSKLAAERRSYVGLLASGLAHEIRNPLNAMNMNLQMLEEEIQAYPALGDEDFHQLLGSTKSEIKRLERLVNNFLAYARPAHPKFEPRDLNEVLESVISFLRADFDESRVNVKLDLEPLLPTVDLDETQFKQALMNLLVNARQVLQPGETIRLVSRAGSGGEVIVEVEDNGPGMSEEVRSRIFEVFFSSRGGGTGLGLAIARQIVERHGGRIEVESVEGKGTTFRIHLPRRRSKVPPVPQATEVAP
jgi:signal transduction histidine kinase